ncbi:hypothetical protein RJT34_10759 [Clitoria ternatea]|uniref:Uncharacterized protein n=1 Tax=Clitoria ternatea TaxID=43366 RepID=A0AAN9PHU1_CLITE
MLPAAKFLLATIWLLESNFHFEAYGDAIPSSPTSCENQPCQQVSPPISGYPSYETPTQPSNSPPPSGYSIYGSPPPPPHKSGQTKCPPTTGVQCCTPPIPYTGYGYGPPNPYYGPPNPYYAPPNPYTYVPYGEGHASAFMVLPILLAPLMMFFSYFISLF